MCTFLSMCFIESFLALMLLAGFSDTAYALTTLSITVQVNEPNNLFVKGQRTPERKIIRRLRFIVGLSVAWFNNQQRSSPNTDTNTVPGR